MKKVLLSTVVALSVLGMYGARSADVGYVEKYSDTGLLQETMRKAKIQQQIDAVQARLGDAQQRKASADAAVSGTDGQIAGIQNSMGQERQNAKNLRGGGETVGASGWETAVARLQERIDEVLLPRKQQYEAASAQYGQQIADLQGKLQAFQNQLNG